ncbi:hypothetical protein SEA_SENDITCS_49 [Streptomyces phage SendItCS]|nr:hypothetical protein SEA_SENDITCS_49 [Streptomyces phage SendItCS]
MKKPWTFVRVFDKHNPRWNEHQRIQNPLYISWAQDVLNHRLQVKGYVSANEALELLGFERTIKGGQAGWIRDHSGDGDGYIDFGVWAEGFDHGKAWIHGKLDVMTIRLNVDRTTISMPRRIAKLKTEGKL